ncbi:molybdopterin-dependent oxidoreductase [Kribbella sp. VKM Ac-2568]|uniref:molybdopterin-dependent oxidoreductase n=1 Tax=Kribbella sp. VKM Ac-2568 TaxID=2512219 RepID=UPI0010D3DD59|nr:molybdopterin-dependent oxidoreductase [Kribbella sp. VKM Ac-2568]TCM47105.1 DMSO/TMAO reductase YedYZ molybdopterin-dependent catalytic subunit [Kribbella sp. VKM Ac-2568]
MTVTRRRRALAALGGVLAAGAGLGLGELTAALAGGTSPVVGVGTQLIDLAPGPAKDWAVKNLGTADKPILVGTVLLAVAVFALLAGAIGASISRVAVVMTVVLGLLAILAAATGRTLADNHFVQVLPGIITLLVATAGMILVLRALGLSPFGGGRGRKLPAAEGSTSTNPARGAGSATTAGGSTSATTAGSSTSATTAGGSTFETTAGGSNSATTVGGSTSTNPAGGAGSANTGEGAGRPEGSAFSGKPHASAVATAASADGGAVVAEGNEVGEREAEAPVGFDRRRFLATTMALGVAGVGGLAVSRVLPEGVSEATRRGIRIPTPASRAQAVPAGVMSEIPGVSRFVTSNPSFYRVDTLLTVPKVDPRNWELRIHGLVDRELRLNFADLLGRRLIERDITLTCVSNEVGGPYVGNARWIGVPIAEILREAGVRDGADAVKSTSVDGLTIGTPLKALTDGRDAIFAVGMNGEPLPFEHGFPVRMVVPGLYGYVSATKWIVDFEVTKFSDFSAYWTDRGWSVEAPIKTSSRIDVPKGFARIKAGPAVAAGVAWAQHRGIAKVEVQVDDGDWQPATLAAEDTIDTWRQWTFRWNATPGNHRLTVRATDGDGQVQTTDRAAPRPNGSSGLHNTVVMVE